MSTTQRLTEREQFWLAHLRECSKDSDSLKGYAEAKGLSVSALYEVRSRLKRKGLLPEQAASPSKFVRVERTAGPPPPASLCRIHFRNGTVMELACPPEQWEQLMEQVARLS